MAHQFGGEGAKVRFWQLDVDHMPRLAERLGVHNVPAWHLYAWSGAWGIWEDLRGVAAVRTVREKVEEWSKDGFQLEDTYQWEEETHP